MDCFYSRCWLLCDLYALFILSSNQQSGLLLLLFHILRNKRHTCRMLFLLHYVLFLDDQAVVIYFPFRLLSILLFHQGSMSSDPPKNLDLCCPHLTSPHLNPPHPTPSPARRILVTRVIINTLFKTPKIISQQHAIFKIVYF